VALPHDRGITTRGSRLDGSATDPTASRLRVFQIGGLALLLLCAGSLDWISGDQLTYSDERDYATLAQSLLHRGTFAYANGAPIVSRPPGYPVVIAAIYSVIERPVAVKIANALFLALATFVLGLLAGRLDPRAPALVPYLVLAYPLLLYAAGTLYPQILACLLLAVVVMLITRQHAKVTDCVFAGIAYGALILAVPYFLALLPLLAGYVFIRGPGSKRRTAVLATALVLASAVVVTPWTLRNYLVFHTFVPVSANNGYNLFVGNSPETTPNSGLNVPVLKLCNHLRSHMTETDFDAAFRQCALDWISANPAAAAQLYLGKLVNYFNYRNEIATAGQDTGWREWLVFFTYYPLLLLVLIRAALFRRFPFERAEILIYLLYFLNACASALFFTRLRFRIPFDFLLIAIEAGFICRCWESLAEAAPGRRGRASASSSEAQ
jgi:hypothetical protein